MKYLETYKISNSLSIRQKETFVAVKTTMSLNFLLYIFSSLLTSLCLSTASPQPLDSNLGTQLNSRSNLSCLSCARLIYTLCECKHWIMRTRSARRRREKKARIFHMKKSQTLLSRENEEMEICFHFLIHISRAVPLFSLRFSFPFTILVTFLP